jgi:hypothetical protein
MPGKVVKVSTAKNMRKGGIRQIRRGNQVYYEIRTESGKWKQVPRNAKVWHRGNGKWSHYTGKVDKKLPKAGGVEGKKRYGHTGDKRYQTPKNRYIRGTTRKKDAKYGKARKRKRTLRERFNQFIGYA